MAEMVPLEELLKRVMTDLSRRRRRSDRAEVAQRLRYRTPELPENRALCWRCLGTDELCPHCGGGGLVCPVCCGFRWVSWETEGRPSQTPCPSCTDWFDRGRPRDERGRPEFAVDPKRERESVLRYLRSDAQALQELSALLSIGG